ncbi:MAG: hypothetical protein JOZ78_16730 [Chroococcidiopsidaceae cyanobacterium CP_BM_ER_R8_30]|nr:hypothetical protein [Chroococcidiopsidaceae cyanobacterium CP_BM_ER_R8_30]
MTENHIQAEFPFQLMLQFLKLSQAPLRKLLNQCQLSTGLTRADDSALFIDCYSLPDVRELGQEQAKNLALTAEILGIRWIFILYYGKPLYAFNSSLLLHCSEQLLIDRQR